MARELRRPRWMAGMVGMFVLLISLGVSVAGVASPSTVDVERADAVLVHAGPEHRFEVGMALVEAGVAPVLVLSDAEMDYERGQGFMNAMCGREEPIRVMCRAPEPFSTIGEAQAFGALVEQRGWERVVVVTSRRHLARARMAVDQCTDAQVLPVAADPGMSPGIRTVRDEWLRTVATATVLRAC